MLFFSIIALLYTLINVYLYNKGRKALPARRHVQIGYGIVFFILYSAFIVAMLGRNSLPLEVQKITYRVGVVWLGAMIYLLIWFLGTDLVSLFFKKRWVRLQTAIGYVLTAGLLLYGFCNFIHPVVVEKDIYINKACHAVPDEVKVVALSDLHLGVAIDKKQLQRYVKLINAQQPDMIWIAGDIVDNNVLPLEQEWMYEEFRQLHAPLGVYACLGNHEYLSGIDGSLAFLRKTGMTLLVDSAAHIADRFWLIGRDDKKFSVHRQPLSALVAQTDTTQALFLLDHEPYDLEEAERAGIDLQFSGHTHEGQIWPISLITHHLFEQAHGYLQKGRTQYYISSGLGLWGPPCRIGTQSEIVVLHLHFVP